MSEYDFAALNVIGSWKKLIAAEMNDRYYLGTREEDGMECIILPSIALLQKAFISAIKEHSVQPEGVYAPDLFSSRVTLDEAQTGFKRKLNEKGIAICPCCEDKAVIYSRKLPASGLVALAIMVHKNVIWRDGKVDDSHEIPYMHISELPRQLGSSREICTVAKWGFIQQGVNKNSKKRTSGMWRPTVTGANYSRGFFKVRDHVVLYRNKILRFEGDMIAFDDVVSRFDYKELMNDIGGKEENTI